ncbi:uncharacterized protein LOC142324048 [Lycorma delicatula]|uniref:uncharacterized protein LOC142324048 n=1 Tax=Lycorma delicatula TaxID=130591 RepID=UPI003F513D92
MRDLRIFELYCIFCLFLEAAYGNVLLMSKDGIHLQQEQLSNIFRTVRSKVGQPKIIELWEGTIGNNGEYPEDFNRVRRSVTEIPKEQSIEEKRISRSLNQPSSVDVPANELQESRIFNDRDQIHVVSSAIRVLSKKENENDGEQTRKKRNEYQWRKPRTQFVTRTERMSPLAPRYQFPPDRSDRYLLDNEITPSYRRASFPQRRIIYFATLPEIVRRPTANDWPQQQLQVQQQQHQYSPPLRQQPAALDSRPYYPLVRDNEVTRVQSSVIDVTNRDPPASPSQTPTIISSVLASPKYTIIDAEPPQYTRPYYNNYPYNVRYPQPYYNYNSNRYYYDDIRTPPYRIQQTFQPPYYSKPEYIPIESPTPSPTAPASSSTSQQGITESNQQHITPTNTTNTEKNNDKINNDNNNNNNINNNNNNNSVHSRYI